MNCSPSPFFGERYDSSNSQVQFLSGGTHHPFRVCSVVVQYPSTVRNGLPGYADTSSNGHAPSGYRGSNNDAPPITHIDGYPPDSAAGRLHPGYSGFAEGGNAGGGYGLIFLNAGVLAFQPLPLNKELEAYIIVTLAFERPFVKRV